MLGCRGSACAASQGRGEHNHHEKRPRRARLLGSLVGKSPKDRLHTSSCRTARRGLAAYSFVVVVVRVVVVVVFGSLLILRSSSSILAASRVALPYRS